MAILITGGAGYIGSHMAWRLHDAGEAAFVLDRAEPLSPVTLPESARFVQGDYGDVSLVADLLRAHEIRSIFHFGGSVAVPESVARPLEYYDNNTCRSHALIAAAAKGDVSEFIYSSTAAVYGQPGSGPVKESDPVAPISPYGWSKLMVEQILRDAARALPMKYVTLRYFNVAGADPRGRAGQAKPGSTHLVKVACEAALGKRDGLDVFGTDYDTPDGTGVRDYIHVTDLVAGHTLALQSLREGGDSDTFNCGYGHGYSVLEVVDAVRRVSGREIAIRFASRRPGDSGKVIADSGKLRSILDWKPQYDDIEEIVAHALDWERKLWRK